MVVAARVIPSHRSARSRASSLWQRATFDVCILPYDPNANTARVSAIFWIEHVKDEKGNEFDQLQYTQRVLLNFNGLSWPHITVATLR